MHIYEIFLNFVILVTNKPLFDLPMNWDSC